MSDDVSGGVTAADRARGLQDDLALCSRYNPDDCPFDPDSFAGRAAEGWPAAIRRATAAEAEVVRLRGLLERDRTGLAKGLAEVRRLVKGWDWLGRPDDWGSYPWPERTVETLRAEVSRCLTAVNEAAVTALWRSGDRVTVGLHGKPEAPGDPAEASGSLPPLAATPEALGMSPDSYWWRYATAMPSVLGLVRRRLDVARLVLPAAWAGGPHEKDVDGCLRRLRLEADEALAEKVAPDRLPPLAGDRALAVFYSDPATGSSGAWACAGVAGALAAVREGVGARLDRLGGYLVVDLDNARLLAFTLDGLVEMKELPHVRDAK